MGFLSTDLGFLTFPVPLHVEMHQGTAWGENQKFVMKGEIWEKYPPLTEAEIFCWNQPSMYTKRRTITSNCIIIIIWEIIRIIYACQSSDTVNRSFVHGLQRSSLFWNLFRWQTYHPAGIAMQTDRALVQPENQCFQAYGDQMYDRKSAWCRYSISLSSFCVKPNTEPSPTWLPLSSHVLQINYIIFVLFSHPFPCLQSVAYRSLLSGAWNGVTNQECRLGLCQ